ncbi:unnamed protein product [Arabis nemorensis]|uniref:UspA domain-containing protein n=1 Tax=Arabis nemorensis TaxID=586526 RepID=A0A565BI20_9BRAS|nr:unnamed protein product [Arabis nemorensis]
MEDIRRVVVVVEDKEAARTALQWALHNFLRQGDVIILLHVFSSLHRKKKSTAARLLRRHGYHLALSFREICDSFFNTNTEIIVREGDEDGRTIAEVVKEIGASTLLVGLHQNSFLYRWEMRNFDCKVMAIKQPSPEQSSPVKAKGRSKTSSATATSSDSLTNFDFSQIEISGLQVPEIPTPKVPYRLCPSPHAILWRTRPRRSKTQYGVVS